MAEGAVLEQRERPSLAERECVCLACVVVPAELHVHPITREKRARACECRAGEGTATEKWRQAQAKGAGRGDGTKVEELTVSSRAGSGNHMMRDERELLEHDMRVRTHVERAWHSTEIDVSPALGEHRGSGRGRTDRPTCMTGRSNIP